MRDRLRLLQEAQAHTNLKRPTLGWPICSCVSCILRTPALEVWEDPNTTGVGHHNIEQLEQLSRAFCFVCNCFITNLWTCVLHRLYECIGYSGYLHHPRKNWFVFPSRVILSLDQLLTPLVTMPQVAIVWSYQRVGDFRKCHIPWSHSHCRCGSHWSDDAFGNPWAWRCAPTSTSVGLLASVSCWQQGTLYLSFCLFSASPLQEA